ncbi:MAG: Ada metal-binding domain-containing protein, partial [Planctomycetota bacterium]
MIARGQSEGLPTPAIMYRALVQRDASFDGAFFACVRTTGIFCRPVCSARKPKRENVEFVATAREALHCGYRPCKLCAPLDVPGRHPDWVRLLLDRLAARPSERTTDADLRAMDIDPVAARRYFKRHFGVTYHAFQRSWRLGQAMKRLHDGEGVTSTALASGFDSESGFRDAFRRVFGENPADARAS